MKFTVTREVLNLGLKIIVITIDGVNINKETKKFLNFKEKAYNALHKKYQNFDIETDLILRGFHKIHKEIGLKRRKNTPVNELILKKFLKKETIPCENVLYHLYNIALLDSRLPIFICDKDKINGNITLKLAHNTSTYIDQNGELRQINPNEYIYEDKEKIIQKLETSQNKEVQITKDTKNILITIEGNENTSTEYLIEVASEIIDLITTYCHGKAQIIYK